MPARAPCASPTAPTKSTASRLRGWSYAATITRWGCGARLARMMASLPMVQNCAIMNHAINARGPNNAKTVKIS